MIRIHRIFSCYSVVRMFSALHIALPEKALLEGKAAASSAAFFCKGEETHDTDEEKIVLRQKSIAIYGILYENEDYGFSHTRMADAYEDIAVLLFQNDRAEEAFAHLEKCVDHAVAYDRLSGDVKLTSLCVNMLTFNKRDTSRFTEANCSRNVWNTIQAGLAEGGLYERYREDARLKRIIERLETAANWNDKRPSAKPMVFHAMFYGSSFWGNSMQP